MKVHLPPRWNQEEDLEYNYFLLNKEIELADFIEIHKNFAIQQTINPRVITLTALKLSALYHPLFYNAVIKSNRKKTSSDINDFFKESISNKIVPNFFEVSIESRAIFWLQSSLFLAGVTLSAAIIQNRWSPGTLESKLSRLWQAGYLAKRMKIDSLNKLNLCDWVKQFDSLNLQFPEIFIQLKNKFSEALSCLVNGNESTKFLLTQGLFEKEQKLRFGFVNDLQRLLGENLKAILVYGSSIDSEKFSDYDLMLVVKDSSEALLRLAGKNPIYNGIELNIGIYNEVEFWNYQLISGDNLNTHSLCLFGEVEVPLKTKALLLERNFSFGYIRMRQLIGMISYAQASKTDDLGDNKFNLYQYFIKIPLNVVRGILGALGQKKSKEEVSEWCKNNIHFDVNKESRRCQEGNPADSIAAAALATERVLIEFNKKMKVFSEIPCSEIKQ